jgi:iron-sulfur cluster repair protein YtfE (RIC family)
MTAAQLISEFMMADHAKLDRTFADFQQQQGRDTVQAKLLFDQFMAGLQGHIIWEEELLFPIFEKRAGMTAGGPTEVMRMEHGRIKGFLEEMDARILGGVSEGLDELALGLLELLSSHNQKEEQILYPAIDRMLTDEDRKKVLGDMASLSPAH